MTKTKPLFMWAGGKTKMLKHYAPIERPVYSMYVEPFFGGGAVFLNENPKLSIINDTNSEIMGIYSSVKKDPHAFISECQVYVERYFDSKDRKSFYYGLRSEYWDNPSPSLLYVLMKLGFNGIWQTCKASKGLFGTPAGLLNHENRGQLLDVSNIVEWSNRLSRATIMSGDYDSVVVPSGSFIYLDPPYRDSFTTYGTGFDDSGQERLIATALRWAGEGNEVWLANRVVEGDNFFEDRIPEGDFHYFDVTYTAGRRKRTEQGFEAKPAQEFLCVIKST